MVLSLLKSYRTDASKLSIREQRVLMAKVLETYAKVISPNQNSVEAMKARIEVLEFVSRVDKTTRTRDD